MHPFSPKDVVLPIKAGRAKPKFDHLKFREPGDLSAKERKKKLEDEIKKLQEQELELNHKLEEMRDKYLSRSEVEEVNRSFLRINLKRNDMSPQMKSLCDQIGRQIDETKQALVLALASKSVAELPGRQVSKKPKENLKMMQTALVQKRRVRKIAALNATIFGGELQELEDKISALRIREETLTKRINKWASADGDSISDSSSDTTSNDSSTESSAVDVFGEKTLETEPDSEQKIQTQVVDIVAKYEGSEVMIEGRGNSGETTTEEDSDSNLSTVYKARPAQQQEGLISTEAVQCKDEDVGLESGGHEGDEDLEKEPSMPDGNASSKIVEIPMKVPQPSPGENTEPREPKAKRKLKRNQDKLSTVKKEIAQLKEQVNAKEGERASCIKECEDLGEKVAELEKEIQSQTESEKDTNDGLNENNRQLQRKKRDDQKSEVTELEGEGTRESAIERIRKNLGTNDKYRLATRYHRHFRLFHGPKFDETDEDEEESHQKSLQNLIDQVEELEEKIRYVQGTNKKVDNAMDWRVVLQRELDLEKRWLETRVKRATASDSAENPSVSGARNHFSSSLPKATKDKYYKPLEKDQVRLLVLWPANADHYPLLCTLETYTWGQGTSNPQYAALSYFWGSDVCNGRLYLVLGDDKAESTDRNTWGSTARHALCIPIRNNLFRALLRLRRTDRPVSLWIDVMCINQDDAVEKTTQLEQMIKIYQNAENVCVWLGESDDGGRSEEAMKFIRSIMDFAVLDRYAQDTKQATKWQALAELMRDRWFSRRWVVQEISLAREATVHCGGISVQWSDFADAVSLLASNQETIKKLFDYSEWRDGPSTLGDVQSFGAYILLEATNQLFLRTAQGQITRPVKSLESLVTSLKTFDVTDGKDLIYSLVSIASDTPQGQHTYSGKKDPVPFTVNYEKPTLRVYKDFTKFCILSSKSIDVLCRPWALPVTGDEKAIELPSWIPLLSQSEFGNPEEVYRGRKNGDNLVGPVGRPHYKASGGTSFDVTQLDKEKFEDSQVLPVTGFKLARIEDVSPRTTGGVILRDSLEMGGWTGTNEHTVSVPDKVWRTLVADRDPNGQIPPTWYQRACLRCLEIADTFNNGDLNIGELLNGNSELIKKYVTRVRSVTWNRRFFNATMGTLSRITEQGKTVNMAVPEDIGGNDDAMAGNKSLDDSDHAKKEEGLFGLGPPDMMKGDHVCILYGCSVPLILRSHDGRMKLIGGAYIHGKMEGEAMEDLQGSNTTSREMEFELI
ncbi:hypothetical protein ANO14919_082700 [Xylariales sp. No.14919]|nr:hypothetical protein ANO14919_082700 [Xylariales sp. No.14919]